MRCSTQKRNVFLLFSLIRIIFDNRKAICSTVQRQNKNEKKDNASVTSSMILLFILLIFQGTLPHLIDTETLYP